MTDRPPPNPYPGPRPFRAGEKLYGRTREITKLFYLLSAERIVVLHSPSGAGKSSLLDAGLVPRLKMEGFDVWPGIRLTEPPANGGNRFARSAVSSLEEGLPAGRRRPAERIAGQSLSEYIARRPRRPGAPSSVALVFDQFEEILTLDPLGLDGKREFFRQLGEALENPEVWALFALREDYLGALDPYRDDVPTRLGNTFRIDLLTVDAAEEAIVQPAHDAGREFAPDAARRLADDLATVSVQQPDGSFENEKGIYVEPLQLQVVCRRLWDDLPPDTQPIDAVHLRESGDVDAALAAYYEACVAEIAHSDVLTERGLREWFSDWLITAAGIRGQVLREQGASGGLDNDSVDRLVTTHLVRSEQRDGKTWYELAHDRLVTPVRDSNAAWFEQRLHPMQRQAALWEREGRPEGLLLRGQELNDAQTWAQANPTSLRPVESDLLHRSVVRRQAERRRRRTVIAVGAALLALVALFAALGAWALVQRSDARNATASATSLALASAANQQLDARPDVALLLGLEAYRAHPSVQARNSVISALERARRPGTIAILRGHTGAVDSVAFSSDGHTLASAGDDGTIRLWDVTTHRQLGQPLPGHGVPVQIVAFSPDRHTLASADANGTIRLWNVTTHRQLGQPLPGSTESGGSATAANAQIRASVAFSADGHILAAAVPGGIQLWNVTTHRQLGGPFAVYHDPTEEKYTGVVPLQSVAFSPHGDTLASASPDGTVRLWNADTRHKRGPSLPGESPYVPSIAFSPDGHTLASATNNGVQLWNITTHAPRGHPLPGAVEGIAFSTRGRILATAGDDGTVRLWNVATRRPLGEPLRGHTGAVESVAFSPDGHTLASAGADGTVRLWNVITHMQGAQPLHGNGGDFSSFAFSPDRRILAAASWDGIRLWELTTRQPIGQRLPVHTSSDSIVAFSPDGQTLASTNDHGIQLWNVTTQHPRGQPFGGHTGALESVAFSPDGDTLASAGWDGTVRLWNVISRQQRGQPLPGHTGEFPRLAFSPDGQTLAAASDAGVQLWDVTTHKQLGQLKIGASSSVAFSPDRHTLAAAGAPSAAGAGTIRLWDVTTHKQLGQPLPVQGSSGSILAFSPDGHTLATYSDVGTVQLWDVTTHQQLGQSLVSIPPGAVAFAGAVAFTPDGRTVAFANEDRTVGFWKGILWNGFDDLRTQVCDLVWGNLTPAEWEQYAPGLPYRTTCPS